MEVNGNKGNDVVTLAAAGFTGTVYGGQGDDTIPAANVTTAGARTAATATGATISGDIGNDNLTGTNGIDTISGGDGNDAIDGNTGADVITGGAGADTLTLAAGDSVVAAASSTGFKTFSDFAATTQAATSDVLNVGADTVTAVVAVTFANAGATTLAADLAAAGLTLAGAGDVEVLTITGAVAWAGNYVVVGDATGGYNAADTVIQVGSTANMTEANFAQWLA